MNLSYVYDTHSEYIVVGFDDKESECSIEALLSVKRYLQRKFPIVTSDELVEIENESTLLIRRHAHVSVCDLPQDPNEPSLVLSNYPNDKQILDALNSYSVKQKRVVFDATYLNLCDRFEVTFGENTEPRLFLEMLLCKLPRISWRSTTPEVLHIKKDIFTTVTFDDNCGYSDDDDLPHRPEVPDLMLPRLHGDKHIIDALQSLGVALIVMPHSLQAAIPAISHVQSESELSVEQTVTQQITVSDMSSTVGRDYARIGFFAAERITIISANRRRDKNDEDCKCALQ
jgi:hypothetical protein